MSANLIKALVEAARNGNVAVAKRLLVKGANPKGDQSLALQAAAENGHLEAVKLLLPVSDPTADSSWALQLAAENGHLEVVKLLLPVSDPKTDCSYALLCAARSGHLEIVKLLLPVSDHKSCDSWALPCAAQNGHMEIVKLLLPLSDITKIMMDLDFIRTDGCDLLLSCLPLPDVKEFVTIHPDIDFPRTRALLATESLRQRPAASSNVTKLRHRA